LRRATGCAKVCPMTTLEQIEMVEAWAWLRAAGGLPSWDDPEEVGLRGHQRMELKFFGHMQFRYTHVDKKWFALALWGAWTEVGEPGDLVNKAKDDVRKKFTRTPPTSALAPHLVDDVLANLPPFEPGFDGARRLTKTILAFMQDDWTLAREWKDAGMPIGPGYIKHFRRDLSPTTISKRIANAKESNDD
jgi:hypothetical protein